MPDEDETNETDIELARRKWLADEIRGAVDRAEQDCPGSNLYDHIFGGLLFLAGIGVPEGDALARRARGTEPK